MTGGAAPGRSADADPGGPPADADPADADPADADPADADPADADPAEAGAPAPTGHTGQRDGSGRPGPGPGSGGGRRADRRRGGPGRSWKRRLAADAVIAALAIAVAVVVRTFVAQAYWIPSGSMIPQLEINDRVVVSRLSYDLHKVHRGDIVVFKSPPGIEPPVHVPTNPADRVFHDIGVALGFAQDQTVLIKRVIGLPGDRIQATGGHVYIDGRRLVEPYLPQGTSTSSFGPLTIPAGRVFVMGDNRGDSLDSRVFGPIPESSIVGRAIWKVWPVWRASFL